MRVTFRGRRGAALGTRSYLECRWIGWRRNLQRIQPHGVCMSRRIDEGFSLRSTTIPSPEDKTTCALGVRAFLPPTRSQHCPLVTTRVPSRHHLNTFIHTFYSLITVLPGTRINLVFTSEFHKLHTAPKRSQHHTTNTAHTLYHLTFYH